MKRGYEWEGMRERQLENNDNEERKAPKMTDNLFVCPVKKNDNKILRNKTRLKRCNR